MNKMKALLVGAAAMAVPIGPARAEVIFTSGGSPGEQASQHWLTPATPDGNVTITLPDGTPFHYLFFDIDTRGGEVQAGTVTFTTLLPSGHELVHTFAVEADVRNLFTVLAIDGDAIAAFNIASELEIEKVDLLRIGAVAAGDGGVSLVPEPAAIGLLGLGLVATGLVRRRIWRPA